MRSRWVGTLLSALLVAGCGATCGDVNCGGGGAYVEWREDQLPRGGVRICVNGTCDEVAQPERLANGRVLVTFNPEGGGIDLGERIAVRLELTVDGRVLTGDGGRSSGCCPAYYFDVSDDGQALIGRD
jgi:hypothetical protein